MLSLRQIVAGVLVSVAATSSVANANNNLFLPGDAFFPTLLTQEKLEQLRKQPDGKRLFSYSALGGYTMAFCGYAGYRSAIVEAVDKPFLDKLGAVYRHIRESEPRQLVERRDEGDTQFVETNGIGVLFYAADAPSEVVLGLRYNERWVEEATAFGHTRRHLRLCCLVNDPRAVALSWRDAEAIAALPARVPALQRKQAGVDSPILVRAQVKAIVIGSSTPTELFQVTDDAVHYRYTISSDGIEERRDEYGETTVLPWREAAGKWLPPTAVD